VAGPCEHSNEPSGSINGGEFLEWLSDCQLLKKDSAPWSFCVTINIEFQLLKCFDFVYLRGL
jgi:hypothetical protein